MLLHIFPIFFRHIFDFIKNPLLFRNEKIDGTREKKMAVPTFHSKYPVNSHLPTPFFRPCRRFRRWASPSTKSSLSISIISAWMHARVPLTAPATSGFWKNPKKRRFTTCSLLPFSAPECKREFTVSWWITNVMTLNTRPIRTALLYGRWYVNIMPHINTMNHIANETKIAVNFGILFEEYMLLRKGD